MLNLGFILVLYNGCSFYVQLKYYTRGKCSFVDNQKVVDKIDGHLMFFKLARHGVDCQMVKIIKSMYANINLCVRYKNQMSEFIIC